MQLKTENMQKAAMRKIREQQKVRYRTRILFKRET
jgi:hypothetical protein